MTDLWGMPSSILPALICAIAGPTVLAWITVRVLRLRSEWAIVIPSFLGGLLINLPLLPIENFIARSIGQTRGLSSAAIRATLEGAIPEQVATSIVFLLAWLKYGQHLKAVAPATGAFAVAMIISPGRNASENVIYLFRSFTLLIILSRVVLPPVMAMIWAVPLGAAVQRAAVEGTNLTKGIVAGTLFGIISHSILDTGMMEVFLLTRGRVGTPLPQVGILLSLVGLAIATVSISVLLAVLPYWHSLRSIWRHRRGRVNLGV